MAKKKGAAAGGAGREAGRVREEGMSLVNPNEPDTRAGGVSFATREVTERDVRALNRDLHRDGLITGRQYERGIGRMDSAELAEVVQKGNLTESEIGVLMSAGPGATPGAVRYVMNKAGRMGDTPAVLQWLGIPQPRIDRLEPWYGWVNWSEYKAGPRLRG